MHCSEKCSPGSGEDERRAKQSRTAVGLPDRVEIAPEGQLKVTRCDAALAEAFGYPGGFRLKKHG